MSCGNFGFTHSEVEVTLILFLSGRYANTNTILNAILWSRDRVSIGELFYSVQGIFQLIMDIITRISKWKSIEGVGEAFLLF